MLECLKLFYVFFKIGLFGFGGGYTMLSMIMTESQQFGITVEQFADLNALDMIIPGPIAINASTYVGYLNSGFLGALSATIGVSLPSFIIITIVIWLITRFRESNLLNNFLSGIKPAAVGLIAAAAMTIASGVLLIPGAELSTLFSNPIGTISILAASVFLITAFTNIRFKANPILLTLGAGVLGAVLYMIFN